MFRNRQAVPLTDRRSQSQQSPESRSNTEREAVTLSRAFVACSLPPPLDGRNLMTKAMVDRLFQESHLDVEVLDLTPTGSERDLRHRFRQSLKMVRRLLAMSDGIPTTVYQSLPGGVGIWNSIIEGLAVRALGYRLIVHHHSYAYLDNPTIGMSLYRRLVAPDVDVVLSEEMSAKLKSVVAANRVRVVDNGALLPPEYCQSAVTLAKEPVDRAEDGRLVIGQLSNLCVEKGSVELIEAARTLLEHGQNVELRLAGPMRDNETRVSFDRLSADFPDRANHVGPVSEWSAKLDFYRSLDLFVFPSKYKVEAQPAVIYEAAAAGTSVLAATVGTISSQLAVFGGNEIDTDSELAAQLEVFCGDDAVAQLRRDRRTTATKFARHRKASREEVSSFVYSEFLLEAMVPRVVYLSSRVESRLPSSTRKIVRLVSKVLRALCHPVSRRALRQGVAPAFEHRAVLNDLEVGTVLDVGANRGQFALTAFLSPQDLRIVSFEPIPDAARVFTRVFSKQADIDLRTTAIGSRPGRLPINISASDDSSSLLPIGDLQVETFPGTGLREVIDVSVSTLDIQLEEEELRGPVFLKLDVQGFELEVLKGAKETLSRTDFVYCEVSFLEFYDDQPLASEIIDFLDGRGFSLSRISQVTRDKAGSVLQADLLFRKR